MKNKVKSFLNYFTSRGEAIKAAKYAYNPVKDKDGFLRIGFDGRMVLLHHVIWTLVNGNIPEDMHVVHIDGDKNNNVIKNLKLLRDGEK